MRRRRPIEKSKSEGSIWTSYSDMFTSLSVIFLVMFVFAILKSQVTAFKSMAVEKNTEKILKGKVPKAVKEEMAQKKQKLNKSINKISVYKDAIKGKITELNELIHEIEGHKTLVSELLNQQTKREAVMNEIQDTLHTTRVKLQERNLKIKKNDQQITKMDHQIKISQSRESELKDSKDKMEQSYEEKLVIVKRDLIEKLKQERNSFKKLQENYEQVITEKSKQVQTQSSLVSELSIKTKKLSQSLEVISKEASQKTVALKAIEAKYKSDKVNYELMHKKVQEYKVLNQSAEESEKRNIQVAKQEKYKSTLMQEKLSEMASKLGSTQRRNKNIESRLNKQNEKMSQIQGELKGLRGDNKKLLSLNKQMRGTLKGKQAGNGRSIASAKDNLRKKLAKQIHQKLGHAKLGLGITTDPETGNITFLMDDSFLFTNNSYELTDGVKETLKAIIPIYSKVLFEDPQVSDAVMSVNIIGHASPTFRHTYVDPKSSDPEAYSYNLSLSSNRSSEIAVYILGPDFTEFPNRLSLRNKIKTIGKSYSLPVLRSPSSEPSTGKQDCGEYDCYQSRRVEINFTLKDDTKVIDSLYKLIRGQI